MNKPFVADYLTISIHNSALEWILQPILEAILLYLSDLLTEVDSLRDHMVNFAIPHYLR